MKFLFLILGCVLLCATHAHAGFSNGGTMKSNNLNLSIGGTLDNNGSLIGTQSAYIKCDTITGKGLISSPQITLKAKIFAYTGTIDCSGICTIITSSPVDVNLFKRTGGGQFVYVVDANQVKHLQGEYLIQDTLDFQTE